MHFLSFERFSATVSFVFHSHKCIENRVENVHTDIWVQSILRQSTPEQLTLQCRCLQCLSRLPEYTVKKDILAIKRGESPILPIKIY